MPRQETDNPILALQSALNQKQPAVRSNKALAAYLFTKRCTAVTRHAGLKNELDHLYPKNGRVQQALKQTRAHGRACLVNTARTAEIPIFARFVYCPIQ